MLALLSTTSSILTNKYLYKKTPHDPLTDLTPLVRVCLAPIARVVTADTRCVPLPPEVSTFAEASYRQDTLSLLGGLAITAPRGLPADVTRQCVAAANHAVANRADMARTIAAVFVPVDDDTPEKFARLWVQEAPVWVRLLQAADVQPT